MALMYSAILIYDLAYVLYLIYIQYLVLFNLLTSFIVLFCGNVSLLFGPYFNNLFIFVS